MRISSLPPGIAGRRHHVRPLDHTPPPVDAGSVRTRAPSRPTPRPPDIPVLRAVAGVPRRPGVRGRGAPMDQPATPRRGSPGDRGRHLHPRQGLRRPLTVPTRARSRRDPGPPGVRGGRHAVSAVHVPQVHGSARPRPRTRGRAARVPRRRPERAGTPRRRHIRGDRRATRPRRAGFPGRLRPSPGGPGRIRGGARSGMQLPHRVRRSGARG